MIDTSSVEALARSVPEIPQDLMTTLLARTRRPDAWSSATASLAQRGFLGCLPFAHNNANEIVLRVLPGIDLARSRVAVAWWTYREATSIAADLAHFVAGRMAHADLAHPLQSLRAQDRDTLIELAARFGDTSCARRVLDVLEATRSRSDVLERMAALFGAADPGDPFGQILSAVWARDGSALAAWLDDAITRHGDEPIVQRLWLSTEVSRRSDADVSEIAWRLICGDEVFDPTYTGEIEGAAYGVYRRDAMIKAIRWFDQHGAPVPDDTLAAVWNAARRLLRDPERYDGRQHLAAARDLAHDRPELAYTLTANAAMFQVRSTGRTPVEAIQFAHELAIANHWSDLVTLLTWCRKEMRP
jgi:hypothetical protein